VNVKKHKTIIIGVTGGFGTGKSTIAGMFKTFGAEVLDADTIARKTLKKGTISYQRIARMFGSCILDKFGRIDRAKLAQIVFRNRKSLDKLCNIVHPVVIDKISKSIKKISNSRSVPAVVIDAPLLIEAGLHNIADYLIVAKTSQSTQIKRAMKKTGLSAGEIKYRIRNQMPLSKKIMMADFVIDNEGSKSDTQKTVKKMWEELKDGRE